MTKTIGVNLNRFPVFSKDKTAKRILAQDLGLRDVAKGHISVMEVFLDKIKSSGGKDDEYFKFRFSDDQDDRLEIEDEKIAREIQVSIAKHFANDQEILGSFLEKHQERLAEEKDYVDYVAALKQEQETLNTEEEKLEKEQEILAASEEVSLLQFQRAAWLFGQLEFLKGLDKAQELVKTAEYRDEQIKNAKDSKKAANIDVSKMLTEALHTSHKKKSSEYYSPATIGQESRAKNDLRTFQNGVERHKKVFKQALSEGSVSREDIGSRGRKSDREPLRDLFDSTFRYSKSLVGSVCHPVTKGILTASNPVYSSKWKEFRTFANRRLAQMCNDPEFEAMKGQLERLQNEHDTGLLSKADFDALIEFNKAQVKVADKEHAEYLKKLEKAAKEANEAILKKITDDNVEGDDLNKYRIIQLLLLVSPLLPIPIAGIIFNAFQPFLGGALNIPDFLGSFFSVNGPFGNVAWLTDKMGLDDLTSMIGNLFGGPLSIVQNLIVNPVTSPVMTSVGGGFAGSPLAGFALMAAFDVVTNYTNREIDRLRKSSDILPDAKKAFEATYEKLRAEEVKRLGEQGKKSVGGEIDLRKNLFVAAKAANWLQGKYKSSPEACNALIKNLFGDKAPELMKALKDGGGVIENIFKLKDENGFKSLLQLREAEDGKNSKLVDKVFDLDNKIKEVNQLKAKYKFESKAEGEVIKITDIFEADGKTYKEKFLADDKKSLKFADGLVELVVDGKPQYYSVKNDPQAEATLRDLFMVNGSPQKLVERQKAALPEATKDVDYNKIVEGLKGSDFYFYEAEKLDIPHNYLPLQGNQLLKEELARSVAYYADNGCQIYGQDIRDKAAQEKMVDQMILVDFISRENSDLHDLLLDESYKDSDFDLDEFLKRNLDGNQQKEILEKHKPIKQDELIVMQNYLNENRGKTIEDAQEYLIDEGLDNEFALSAKVQEIEKNYESKKKTAAMQISVLVDEHYGKAFEGAKWVVKKAPKSPKVSESKMKTESEMEDVDRENEQPQTPQTPQTPQNQQTPQTPQNPEEKTTKKRDLPFVERVGGSKKSVVTNTFGRSGDSDTQSDEPQSPRFELGEIKKRPPTHAENIDPQSKKSKVGTQFGL